MLVWVPARVLPRRASAVPFGQLPKEERKAINKDVHKDVRKGGFDNTAVCLGEIGAMLSCFEKHDFETQPCHVEIDTMYACVDLHKNDPVGGGGSVFHFKRTLLLLKVHHHLVGLLCYYRLPTLAAGSQGSHCVVAKGHSAKGVSPLREAEGAAAITEVARHES